MDREQFLHSIKSDNLEAKDIVVNFFDQYMLLYDLIDTVKDTTIINSNKSSISFQLDFSNDESVIKLCEKIEAYPVVTIFNSVFNISYSAKKESPSVIINIQC